MQTFNSINNGNYKEDSPAGTQLVSNPLQPSEKTLGFPLSQAYQRRPLGKLIPLTYWQIQPRLKARQTQKALRSHLAAHT